MFRKFQCLLPVSRPPGAQEASPGRLLPLGFFFELLFELARVDVVLGSIMLIPTLDS